MTSVTFFSEAPGRWNPCRATCSRIIVRAIVPEILLEAEIFRNTTTLEIGRTPQRRQPPPKLSESIWLDSWAFFFCQRELWLKEKITFNTLFFSGALLNLIGHSYLSPVPQLPPWLVPDALQIYQFLFWCYISSAVRK